MSEYFSTQASIEARISALRLRLYDDFNDDQTPNSANLTSAFKAARGECRGYLTSRFGETEIDTWTSDTVPELVGTISDDLCIHQILLSNPRFAEFIQILRDNAIDKLEKIASGAIMLYGVNMSVDDQIVTERMKSDFDPERDTDNLTVNPNWIRSDPRELPDYPE